jgi:hypothetical protein
MLDRRCFTGAMTEALSVQAIAHPGGLWPGLLRLLDDSRATLDANTVELVLRGVGAGRNPARTRSSATSCQWNPERIRRLNGDPRHATMVEDLR